MLIQKHKCVALEDLAAEFNLRTQVSVSRLSAFVVGEARCSDGVKGIRCHELYCCAMK